MTEEQRAELHRQQAANRVAWEDERLAALAGNPIAAEAVRTAWQPRVGALHPQPTDVLPDEVPCPPAPRVPDWVQLPERYRC